MGSPRASKGQNQNLTWPCRLENKAGITGAEVLHIPLSLIVLVIVRLSSVPSLESLDKPMSGKLTPIKDLDTVCLSRNHVRRGGSAVVG